MPPVPKPVCSTATTGAFRPRPSGWARKRPADLEKLGRIFLQFNKAVNRLYRQSVEGKQPAWIARWLDLGKPAELIELQRAAIFKNEWPRVIRPDLLITENGLSITELDSVPGGIGLTAWLNQTYSKLGAQVVGGADGMLRGFAGIFGDAPRVHIVVSEEAATYRPEMEWLATQLGAAKFKVHDSKFTGFADGDAVYRFFELFDAPNVANAKQIFEFAGEKKIRATPPPKPLFEEKMLFALLWNRNLRDFWRQELGERFFNRMLQLVPYSWLMDPAPMPPHAAIPELNLTDWNQLKTLSQTRARIGSEGVRLLAQGLGRARCLSRQRPFHRRMVGGGGRRDFRLLHLAAHSPAFPENKAR